MKQTESNQPLAEEKWRLREKFTTPVKRLVSLRDFHWAGRGTAGHRVAAFPLRFNRRGREDIL